MRRSPKLTPPGPAWRFWLPWWGWVLVGLAVLGAVFYLGGGWYFANVLETDALDAEQRRSDLLSPGFGRMVVEVDEQSVQIGLGDDPGELLTDGVWGLEWADGYGQVGAIINHDDQVVVREFRHLSGSSLVAGTMTRLDEHGYKGDPGSALDLAFSEVSYSGELGEYPAWLVDGTADTSIILVHGNGMTREDALRVLPVFHREGYPTLTITFRNDPGAPKDPSGRLGYGTTEWKDVEDAVRFALGEGASEVVLFGYSMGGGIVTSFLYESALADDAVSGVILDAPMLDFGRTVDFHAGQEKLPVVGLGVPQSLTSVAKWMAGWRFDLNWAALDYLDRADELNVPILLFHGTADQDVPIATSDDLAAARPDLVTYRSVIGAGHMESWNVDSAAYETAIVEFLTRIAQ